MTTQRRRTRWLDDFGLIAPAASGQAAAELDTPLAAELHVQGYTIVRVLLVVHALITTLGVNAAVTYGLTLMNSDAVAAGAFPDPQGVDEVPWLLRDRIVGIRDADAGRQEMVRTYDLRAMRKYNGQSSLQFIADADSSSAWSLNVSSRVLVKIP